MQHIKVKIINDSNNQLPAYETYSSAGMDVRAKLDAPPYTSSPYSVPSYPQVCACNCRKAMSARCVRVQGCA